MYVYTACRNMQDVCISIESELQIEISMPCDDVRSYADALPAYCESVARRPVARHTTCPKRYGQSPKKILDCRGFDSGIISSMRIGILMPIGNFLEILSQQILVGIILVGRLGVKREKLYMCVYIYIYGLLVLVALLLFHIYIYIEREREIDR